MRPTQELIAEHDAVLVALQILEEVETALTAGDVQAADDLGQLLDFLRVFVDRCHHGKEEDVLFPEMERLGARRDGGPIGVMLMEHELGRGHVRAMSEGLDRLRHADAAAVTAILSSARAYRELLRAHIYKENNILFPMADRLVPDEVATKVVEQFAAIERDRVGEGKHEAFHVMLHTLKDRYGVA
ncbi:MAG TPA: hemerythrin domain-containing protein [Vicinamibacterales bacterium]